MKLIDWIKKNNVAPLAALAFVLLTMSAHLVACNTTAGVGRDVEAAGDALEDAAEDAND